MRFCALTLIAVLLSALLRFGELHPNGEQPLSRVAIHKAVFALHPSAYVNVSPSILGLKPKLVAVSDAVIFAHPKAPLYPRLAQGKSWNEVLLLGRWGGRDTMLVSLPASLFTDLEPLVEPDPALGQFFLTCSDCSHP
ncbi:hypothetical protein ACLOJK_002479 [Asimina triloba]